MIEYRIQPVAPEAHLFQVDLFVPDPDPQGQVLRLPAWIPGSYMIRDFARQVITLAVWHRDRPVNVCKLDKQTWRCAPSEGPLRVSYQVYAHELSVRAAYLDITRGYFNGPCVFLKIEGQERDPCRVLVRRPDKDELHDWQLATSMEPESVGAGGFGVFRAADYNELIDHPVEMSRFTRGEFSVGGVRHELVITGAHHGDVERLRRDLSKVCQQHVSLFGEIPMRQYLFLVLAVGEGSGGLEHAASTSLICCRDDLPRAGQPEVSNGYRQFLGLCSHEYFHLWNVKRIRPRVFMEQGLDQEVHTRLLWVFEGITSYYDDLALVRSGLISRDGYLELLARNITRLMRGTGRLKQTLEESSFDAWTKFYKQDENAPNAIVSYYTKGSVVALALDLSIRVGTDGKRSLDDVMRALWTRYGKTGRGVGEHDVEPLVREVTGLALEDFFDQALRSTKELELFDLLKAVGIRMQLRPARNLDDEGGLIAQGNGAPQEIPQVLGVRFSAKGQLVELSQVLEGGAAQQAGLAAGDLVIAVDGIRVWPDNLEKAVARVPPSENVSVHAFRRDELMEFRVSPQPAPPDTCVLGVEEEAREPVLRLRRQWLGQE